MSGNKKKKKEKKPTKPTTAESLEHIRGNILRIEEKLDYKYLGYYDKDRMERELDVVKRQLKASQTNSINLRDEIEKTRAELEHAKQHERSAVGEKGSYGAKLFFYGCLFGWAAHYVATVYFS